MAKNYKWGIESINDNPIHVVLFVSRNKDNKDVKDFEERRTSFITNQLMFSEYLDTKFDTFVQQGVPGEMSRMYYSVNARNLKKIHNQLLHFLIDEPDFNLCSISSKIAGIAALRECAAQKRWMFDFDISSEEKVIQFVEDIKTIASTDENPISVEVRPTPHGYAVITNRGFDTRELYKKWDESLVSLKRDDLLCCNWKTKE